MHFIVFDLEWNMPNPWDKIEETQAARMPYEIIEIGAVKLNEQGEEERNFSVRIRPVLYKNINRFVSQVTKMTQLSLNTGYPFQQAIRAFFDFCGTDYIFCSWSDSDSEPLRRNLAFHGFPEDLGVRMLDVQRAFTALIEPGAEQRNVEYALDLLKLPKNEPFHRAISDARYTARVLAKLLEMAEHDGMSAAEFVRRYSYNPDLTLSAAHKLPVAESVQGLLELMRETPLFCPECQEELTKHEDWQLKGKTQQAVFSCSKHGKVGARCRIRKGREGKFLGTIQLRIEES